MASLKIKDKKTFRCHLFDCLKSLRKME